jgi:hypothetical protein
VYKLLTCLSSDTKDEDLEGDFDPEAHDKRMSQLFNSEFYGGDESKKPEFPELDEELEIGKQNSAVLNVEMNSFPNRMFRFKIYLESNNLWP